MENNKEKIDNFLKEFKIKYPDFKILKFKNLTSEMIIEDKNGFKYRKSKAFNMLNRGLNIQSIVDKNEYINFQIKEKFPNLKLLKYNSMKGGVLVEDENKFQYFPQCYDLLQGHIVTIETCNEKEKLFEFKANKVHNNFYEYLPFKYKNGKTKVKINCKIHGIFEQIVESHLSGRGCPKCGYVGFSKESWLKKTKNKTAFFYILKFFNENEEFVKFGITAKNVEARYKTLKNYKFEIIKIVEGAPSEIYDMEKRMLKEYKYYKTTPKLPFEGWTECLSIDCINKIK